jgi:hypothetical protein
LTCGPAECIRHLAAGHFAGKLISLSALQSGVWWLWPNFTKPAITTNLVAGLLLLAIGALAWIVAFNCGRQRYWGQR